jgi:hypothetical protein
MDSLFLMGAKPLVQDSPTLKLHDLLDWAEIAHKLKGAVQADAAVPVTRAVGNAAGACTEGATSIERSAAGALAEQGFVDQLKAPKTP